MNSEIRSIMNGDGASRYFASYQAAWAWIKRTQREIEEATGLYCDGNVKKSDDRWCAEISGAYQG